MLPVGRADCHLLPPGSGDEIGNHKLKFPNSASVNPTACFAVTSPFRGGTGAAYRLP